MCTLFYSATHPTSTNKNRKKISEINFKFESSWPLKIVPKNVLKRMTKYFITTHTNMFMILENEYESIIL